MPTTSHPSPDTLQLSSVSEKQLPAKCKPNTLAYCPTMDLIAVATEDEQVHVFRFNGQEALGHPFSKTGIAVRATVWKVTGRLLAIAGSDNHIRLLGAHNGKIAHDLPCGPPQGREDASISCVAWGPHVTESKDTIESWLRLPDDSKSVGCAPGKAFPTISADLPRDLALLDIERSLPKLSVLPSTGDDDDVFSTRASLDAIFDAKDLTSGIDVLVAGFDDGTIHLRIFNSFDIGSFNIRNSFPAVASIKPLYHACHPMSSTHSLLCSVSPTSPNSSQLSLLTLDLRFIAKAGKYLPLLASKVTQLQNLLRYIKQVQHQIHLEWKNAQDLPSRYISNVNEDLQEKSQCDFVTAVYHLLVTGDCFEPLREFLVDQLGDRGHKRWEKAVMTGYESIQRLTHSCLLPALERCGVILSRLIGLSKYHRLSPVLGLETKDLKECQETVDCLNLLSHKLLIHCRREYREFCAFSKWLRHEVDLQTADPLSATAEEVMERSDTIDYAQTLSYVQGAMTRSALLDFIKPTAPRSEDGQVDISRGRDGLFYESYKKLLRQLEQKKPGEVVNLPALQGLIIRLKTQSDKVCEHIAETQRRGILHRSPLSLSPDCDENVTDIWTEVGGGMCDVVWIVSKSKKHPHMFHIYRVILDVVNGVSSTRQIRTTTLNLKGGEIRDLKYVPQDRVLMLLWRDAGPTALFRLVNIPFPDTQLIEAGREILLNAADGIPEDRGSPEDAMGSIDLLRTGSAYNLIKHTFPADDIEPVRIEVNANKSRRAICVLYSDGLRYSVFDMDSPQDWWEDEEVEVGM